jgi:hypothetical protein
MTTTTKLVDHSVLWSWAQKLPGVPTETAATLRLVRVHSRTTSDQTPGWRDRIKAGKDASTSLTAVRYVAKRRTGLYEGIHKTNPIFDFHMTGDVMANNGFANVPPAAPASVVTEATSAAQIAFAKAYRKQTQNFSGGVFAGQLLQTVRELARPAKGIREGIDQLALLLQKRLRPVIKVKEEAKLTAKVVSETWLEWVFGHRANIQDLDDASKAFRAMAAGRCFDIVRMIGTGKAELQISNDLVTFSPASSFPSGKNYAQVYRSDTAKCEVTIRGAWKNSNPSSEMPLPGNFGVGVLDVLPTAWELIPWSFMADYFINISDVLDAWQMRFVNFAWMNRTTRSSRTIQYSDLIGGSGAGTTYKPIHAYGGQAKSSRFDVTRVPISSTWETGFTVRIPGFGSTRWLNIAALIALRGKPHTRGGY